MMKTWNTQAVEPFEHSSFSTGRALAETIAATGYPEEDENEADMIEEINDAAMEILETDEIDGFTDFDADGTRNYWRLYNGEIGVYWPAAQFVQSGTAKELVEHYVREFREHQHRDV